jgi:uncharacterized membrane protein YcaP (DUF421 family)
MSFLFAIDWEKLFVPKLSVLEMLIRGAGMYVALVLLLRLIPKRQIGQVSISELLVIGLIAGVARNPLVADGYSLTDGLGVIAVVLACSYLVTWLSYRFRAVHRVTHHEPVPLVRDGRVLGENLRKELMTPDRLRSKLRGEGVTDPAEVSEAWLEGDGEISVVKRKAGRPDPERNGHAEADDPDLGEFLAAVAKVEERIRWHRQRAEALRRELARWGLHPPVRERGRRRRDEGASAN